MTNNQLERLYMSALFCCFNHVHKRIFSFGVFFSSFFSLTMKVFRLSTLFAFLWQKRRTERKKNRPLRIVLEKDNDDEVTVIYTLERTFSFKLFYFILKSSSFLFSRYLVNILYWLLLLLLLLYYYVFFLLLPLHSYTSI